MASHSVAVSSQTNGKVHRSSSRSASRAPAKAARPTGVVPHPGSPADPLAAAAFEEVSPAALLEPPAEGEETQPHRTPSEQSIEMRDLLITFRQQLAALDAATEPLATYLEEVGITAEYRTTCTSLCTVLEERLAARRQAMADEDVAIYELENARHLAEAAYSTFRQSARRAVPSSSHAALGLTEKMPDAIGHLISTVHEILTAAQREPYASYLAAATFSSARVESVAARFDELNSRYALRGQAHQAALAATRARNEAAHTLHAAARQLEIEVHGILRLHPELNRPAGF